jgi:hypothetical protein
MSTFTSEPWLVAVSTTVVFGVVLLVSRWSFVQLWCCTKLGMEQESFDEVWRLMI